MSSAPASNFKKTGTPVTIAPKTSSSSINRNVYNSGNNFCIYQMPSLKEGRKNTSFKNNKKQKQQKHNVRRRDRVKRDNGSYSRNTTN